MKTFRILELLILSEDNYLVSTETVSTVSKYFKISVFAVTALTRIVCTFY